MGKVSAKVYIEQLSPSHPLRTRRLVENSQLQYPTGSHCSLRVRVSSPLLAAMTDSFSITKARAQFPALQQAHQVYFDNAGGSQVLDTVASSYARTHSFQPGLVPHDRV